MASGILAAAHNARMVEARGIGEADDGMARTAILIRRYMRRSFAGGDVAVMATHTLFTVHLGTAVIESPPDK